MKRQLIRCLWAIGMVANCSCMSLAAESMNERGDTTNVAARVHPVGESRSMFDPDCLYRVYTDGLPQNRPLRNIDPVPVYLDYISHLRLGGTALSVVGLMYAPSPISYMIPVIWYVFFL